MALHATHLIRLMEGTLILDIHNPMEVTIFNHHRITLRRILIYTPENNQKARLILLVLGRASLLLSFSIPLKLQNYLQSTIYIQNDKLPTVPFQSKEKGL